MKIINVLTVYSDDIYVALDAEWDDFEDALQAQVAVHSGIDVIITRNIKDYKKTINIDIVTPKDFNNYMQKIRKNY